MGMVTVTAMVMVIVTAMAMLLVKGMAIKKERKRKVMLSLP